MTWVICVFLSYSRVFVPSRDFCRFMGLFSFIFFWSNSFELKLAPQSTPKTTLTINKCHALTLVFFVLFIILVMSGCDMGDMCVFVSF